MPDTRGVLLAVFKLKTMRPSGSSVFDASPPERSTVHVVHPRYPGRSPSWLHPWALLWPCGLWVGSMRQHRRSPQTFRLSPTFFSLSHLTLWLVYSHQHVMNILTCVHSLATFGQSPMVGDLFFI